MSTEFWILTCFFIYVLLIFLFAGVYFKLYKSNPCNYSFNSAILKQQVAISQATTKNELGDLQLRLSAYNQLVVELNNVGSQWLINDDGELRCDTQDFHFAFVENVETFIENQGSPKETESTIRSVVLEVYNRDGDRLFSEFVDVLSKRGSLNKDRAFYSNEAAKLINQLETRIKEANRRLAKLSGLNPEVWRYWDFLYFSVITQTTVGYGDILPNSTQVRMIVILQILSGLTLLTVVLNLFLQA